MSETIRVNFSKSIPLFPLVEAVLLPHAVLPLHIFEPRYRQMVSECLDQSGQIAIATLNRSRGGGDDDDSARVRSAACVGQIIQHDALPDGRYNILLHGVCRARIKTLIEPEGDRAFRLARLVPMEPLDEEPAPMPGVRKTLRSLLTSPPLQRLRGIDTLMEWIDREDVPTHALVELIGFAVVRDTETKYQLLAEASPMRRAALIQDELKHIDRMVISAERQNPQGWPKGMSWN
jgi:Lon protease-like protein